MSKDTEQGQPLHEKESHDHNNSRNNHDNINNTNADVRNSNSKDLFSQQIPRKRRFSLPNAEANAQLQSAFQKQKTGIPNPQQEGKHLTVPHQARAEPKRFVVEPGEVTFILTPGIPPNVAEQVQLHNYTATPVFFTTRSTNVGHLRPDPHKGVVKPFSSKTIELLLFQSKPISIKSKGECKRKDRLTFEWIKYIQVKGTDDATVQLKQIPKEERQTVVVKVIYIVEQKYDVSEKNVEKCRHAFKHIKDHVTLRGDFEQHDVTGNLKLQNASTQRIIWNICECNNVLLSCSPKEGILNSGQSEQITVTTKKFHVGRIADVTDVVVVEWTAAEGLVDYSSIAFEDAPKIFKTGVKVFYEYKRPGKVHHHTNNINTTAEQLQH